MHRFCIDLMLLLCNQGALSDRIMCGCVTPLEYTYSVCGGGRITMGWIGREVRIGCIILIAFTVILLQPLKIY